MTAALGRLESVPLRQVWPHEANDFTPWLGETDNLALLAQTLRLDDPQVQGTEMPVGNFKIDILARDIEGHIVVIENQFGSTDHTHLGQILTYVARQNGSATVIWIAETIREEHRAAIDWLNASTIKDFDFFAVEVEALRIGASSPAPRFNVVAKPNDWTRGVARATRSAEAGQLDDTARAYVGYWSGFAAFLREQDARYRIPTPPHYQRYSFGIGRSGFALSVSALLRDRRIGVEIWQCFTSTSETLPEIYISHRAAKQAFDFLKADEENIEAEYGEKLDWQRMNDRKSCRIAVYQTDVDLRDEAQRPVQYAWLLDHL